MPRIELAEGNFVDKFVLNSATPGEGRMIVSALGGFDANAALEHGPLVRMHSACVYGEVLQSTDCDCGPQLEAAKSRMRGEGTGILFYLHQEGRGAGLPTKAKAYELQESEGLDTKEAYERLGVPFDQREYRHCAVVLRDNGITKVRLMSNNPHKIQALEEAGISVVRVPLIVGVTEQNLPYLRTKRDKAGHLFPKTL
ncbi:MAG TPA: GTP cyclohydrolase II [Patescibacteria group bacterium]|nr:GTP cyclohydrolase II [Patescibacteria group bacterium]